jgi:hypothetical protein
LQGTVGAWASNKLLGVLALHILGLLLENTGVPLEVPGSAMKAGVPIRDRAEELVEVQEVIQKIRMGVGMEIRLRTQLVILVGARWIMKFGMPIKIRTRSPEIRRGILEVIQASLPLLVIHSTLRVISTNMIPHDSVSGQTRSMRNAPVHASRNCAT